jgi:hypothetical protein
MLVILTDSQLLSPQLVCPTCLLADQSGQPRWQQGQLRCGRALGRSSDQQPEQFECQMGFRIANVEA